MATIKSLLGMSVEKLEAMTDDEIKMYWGPHLQVVENKPDEEASSVIDTTDEGAKQRRKVKAAKKDNNWMEEVKRLAEKHGIEGIVLPKHL